MRAEIRCSGPRPTTGGRARLVRSHGPSTAAGCRTTASGGRDLRPADQPFRNGAATGTPPFPPRCQGGLVTLPEPGLVAVRTMADHPLVDAGTGRSLRMVATGGVTDGRFGLVEYHLGPRTPGAAPHYHRTFSESFYVLSGELTLFVDGRWQPYRPGDFALAREEGVHGFRNDGDEPAAVLILFTPGIAREAFFAEMAEIGRSGRTPSKEEMAAIYARHDQVMVEV